MSDIERVLAGMRAAFGVREPAVYSSRKGCGPAGYAELAWKAVAPKIGVKRGRWWHVSAAQLEAYEASIATQATAPVSPPSAEAWTPAKAMAAAGLRVVSQ